MPRKENKSFSYKQAISFKPNISPPITKNNNIVPKPYFPPQNPSFGQIVKEGFGFGVGSSIAHNAVNYFLKPTQTKPIEVNNCENYKIALEKCSLDKDCSTEQYLNLEKEYDICKHKII